MTSYAGLGFDPTPGEPRVLIVLDNAANIVAARAVIQPDRPLGELTAELGEDTTRLDALSIGEIEGDLRRVLTWSYEALPTDAATAFPPEVCCGSR